MKCELSSLCLLLSSDGVTSKSLFTVQLGFWSLSEIKLFL